MEAVSHEDEDPDLLLEFARLLGLKIPTPPPPYNSIMTYKCKLSWEIFASYNCIRCILDRHEVTLKTRWLKITHGQRKKIAPHRLVEYVHYTNRIFKHIKRRHKSNGMRAVIDSESRIYGPKSTWRTSRMERHFCSFSIPASGTYLTCLHVLMPMRVDSERWLKQVPRSMPL
jgi:hypothetical protein